MSEKRRVRTVGENLAAPLALAMLAVLVALAAPEVLGKGLRAQVQTGAEASPGAGDEPQPAGEGAGAGASASPVAFVQYAEPGKFEFLVPEGVQRLTVIAGGGGGGGGAGSFGVGGGGGAGAGLYALELPVVPGERIPIVVGAGGKGSHGEASVVGPWTFPGGRRGAAGRGSTGEVDPKSGLPTPPVAGPGGEPGPFGTAGGTGGLRENGGNEGAARKARDFPDGSVYVEHPGGAKGGAGNNTSGGGGGGGAGLNGPGGAGGRGQKKDGSRGGSASANCAGGGGGAGAGRGKDDPGAGGNGGPGWVGIWYADPRIEQANRIAEIQRVIASSPEALRGEIAQLEERKKVLAEEIADLEIVKAGLKSPALEK